MHVPKMINKAVKAAKEKWEREKEEAILKCREDTRQEMIYKVSTAESNASAKEDEANKALKAERAARKEASDLAVKLEEARGNTRVKEAELRTAARAEQKDAEKAAEEVRGHTHTNSRGRMEALTCLHLSPA